MTQLQDSDAFTGTEAQEERPEETRAEPEVGVGQLEVSHLGDIGRRGQEGGALGSQQRVWWRHT